MKKQDFRYKYFDKVVIRTPLFPLGALLKSEDLLASKEFEEAIKIASPEMSRAKGATNKDKNKAGKAEISFHKYFARSSTRCTPFGLFAGCSTVPVSENETGIVLPATDKYRRCTRLDMQYLCALIRHLENNPEIRLLLRFYPNDSIYSIAGQLRYMEYHYKNTSRSHHIASIEQDEYVATILEAAKKGLKPHDLALLLTSDDIDIDDALEFVNEMIDNQVLKSELDPSVVGEDTLTVLISKLKQIGENDIVNKLIEIKSILTDIDNTPIGESTDMYDGIVDIIKSIGVGYEEKFLFQTDMYALLENRKNKLVSLAPKILESVYADETLSLDNLLGSYTHMCLNRLFRSKNRLNELIVYDCLNRHYESMAAREKYGHDAKI